MRSASCFAFILALIIAKCEEESCPIAGKESCGENIESHDKYRKDVNTKYGKYFKAIEEAERSYVECNRTGCACFRDVITGDLEPFKERGIRKKLIEVSASRGTFYQVIKGELYRENDCMFPSRCAGIEYFILQIINHLPDMDLIVNTRDYPQSGKHFGEPLPVFSFSKTLDYFDITYPAWGFWEGGPAISLYPRGLGRWDLHRASLDKASKNTPWDQKKDQVFFRGSRTSSERDNLVLLSRSNPGLVDAQYTRNQAWKSDADTLYAPPAPEASLESHCDFKYLFNYRGVAASFRHKHLFLCRSLVFHVGEEWTEFYYHAMKPWIHYIPVPNDASQETLEEIIQFAKDNDLVAQKIANRGRDFVWNKLRMTDISCFWKSLLKRYAKLLKYEPILDQKLVKIERK